MSEFIDFSGNNYIYNRDGKNYSIAPGLLNSLFRTHGYCVDPGTKSGILLTPNSIKNLKILATNNHDHTLLNTITQLSNGKIPSPRMVNDGITSETTMTEKYRFDHLNETERNSLMTILQTILNIGMYLGGWKGNEEPYITSLRNLHDIIRIELKVSPLIQELYTNPHYPLVKNFLIIAYYRTNSMISKPSVIDKSLNIDTCLNYISSGVNINYHQLASFLISTAYYYITTIGKTTLPMIDPLIISLTTDIV